MLEMNDNELIQHINKSVPGLIALYRFGSQTKGSARPESNVDLAVLAHNPIPNVRLFELAQDMAVQLHQDVDLIYLRVVSTVMRMQVFSTGVCLDAPNEPALREFEMYAYSDCARLNEERRSILNDTCARRSVYTEQYDAQ